eukprot:GFUD01038447.1.p1 GENE.GFUD01038447.1~~GFUD01038447.1.p1  ORF type:complete len:446 (-),score=137.17 GFUD01038447.1:127-1464(-)
MTGKKTNMKKRKSSFSEESSEWRKHYSPGLQIVREQMDTEEKLNKEEKKLIEKKRFEEKMLEQVKRREDWVFRKEKLLKEQILKENFRAEELLKEKIVKEKIRKEELLNEQKLKEKLQKIDYLRKEERRVNHMEEDRLKREGVLLEREQKLKEKMKIDREGRQNCHERRRSSSPNRGNRPSNVNSLRPSRRGAVLDLLASYLFRGIIVTFKPGPGFGFIRSAQVFGDVFVNISNIDTELEEVDLRGRRVLFTLEDVGKKSMEAKSVRIAEKPVAQSAITGKIVAWEMGIGEGLVEVGQTGVMLTFDRIKNIRKTQVGALVGRKVSFGLWVGQNQKVQAGFVKLSKEPPSVSSVGTDLSPSPAELSLTNGGPSQSPAGTRSHFARKENIKFSRKRINKFNKEFKNNKSDREFFTTIDQIGYTEVSDKEIEVKLKKVPGKIVIKRRF